MSWASSMPWNMVELLDARSCGLPISQMRPSSSTTILSMAWRPRNRWAMKRSVQLLKAFRRACCMLRSDSSSRLEVPSSMATTLAFLSSALARHRSCRCPAERLLPQDSTLPSKPPSCWTRRVAAAEFLMACQISES